MELRLLTSQLAYDTSIIQSATRWVGELERRMVVLLPLLSSIGDRLEALRAANGVTPGLDRLLGEMRVWVRAVTPPPPRSESDRLRGWIDRCEAETDPRAGWADVMRDSLLLRLRQLVDVRQDIRDLRQHIEDGGGPLTVALAMRIRGPELLHRDHGMALLSSLAAMLTVGMLCALWIGTGWSAGAGAASLGAAACSLFAALDDPTPALKKFLSATVLAVVFVGIGLFGILPRVHEFEMLALVLGAYFIPVGVLTALPATQPLGTALGFLTATLLSLQSAYSADFVAYADGSFAALLGVAGAAIMTSLMRSVGAEWSARRLLRAGWRDLAAIPRGQTPRESDTLTGLLLDRIGLLVPRLAAVGAGNDLAAVDALTDLRIGINMVDLARDREAMTPAVRGPANAVLFGTANHFAVQAATGRVRRASPALLRDIDRALDAAITAPGQGGRDLLLQLVGIRRGLFADAPPYYPAAPADDATPGDASAGAGGMSDGGMSAGGMEGGALEGAAPGGSKGGDARGGRARTDDSGGDNAGVGDAVVGSARAGDAGAEGWAMPGGAMPAGRCRAGRCRVGRCRVGRVDGMIGEIDVYGVFIPILLVWAMIALILTAVLRRVLFRIGFYRLVWHRPLVDLSLLIIILASVSAAMNQLVVPHWIAPR